MWILFTVLFTVCYYLIVTNLSLPEFLLCSTVLYSYFVGLGTATDYRSKHVTLALSISIQIIISIDLSM